MRNYSFDVAIIGAGTAGLTAYNAATRAGKRAVLIEADKYGTLCAREGCMPSKLLIQAAFIAHSAMHADTFGISIPHDAIHIDPAAVFGRVRKERDRFVNGTVDQTERIPEEFRLKGYARFINPTTLSLEGADGPATVTARSFVLATGSSPRIPPEVQSVSDRLLVSDDIFELTHIPDSIAILGPGIIGLELGQALQRLGSEITFFSPFARIGMHADPEIQHSTRAYFGQSMTFHLNCLDFTPAPAGNNHVEIRWRDADGNAHQQTFEKLLVTTGRTPNVQNLGLETTGLKLDKNGVPVYDRTTMQCGDSPIFIAGDATSRYPLLHEAADEGTIAGTNAAIFPNVQPQSRNTSLAIAFTDPQLAIVGTRFADLEPGTFAIGEVSYENQGRATMLAQNHGLVRIYGCTRTRRLLGAEMFGPGVEHTSHLLAWAHQAQHTVDELLQRPYYHPVLEEGIRTALRRLSKNLG